MLRKILFVFIALCIILLTVLIFRGLWIKAPEVEVNVIDGIPQHTSFIIFSNEFENAPNLFNNKNVIVKELSAIESIQSIAKGVHYLDSLTNTNQNIQLVRKNQFSLSAHMLGRKNYDFLFLLALTNKLQINEIRNIAQKFERNSSPREYEGELIYELTDTANKEQNTIYGTICKNILIASHSSILVENSIRQLKNGQSLMKDPHFGRLEETRGKNVDFNLYIDQKNFPVMLSNYSSDEEKENLISDISYANWSELDVNIKKNSVLLNGFTIAANSTNYLNIFTKQESVPFEIHSVLPSSTSTFLVMGISDNDQFFSDYKDFLREKQQFDKRQEKLQEINRTYSYKIDELFQNVLNKEIGLVYTEVNNSKLDIHTFAVIHTKSKRLTEENIIECLSNYAKKEGVSKTTFIHNFKVDDEITFRFYEFQQSNIPEVIFGPIFDKVDAKYCTFIDNYLIFGSNIKSMAKYLHQVLLKKTLIHDNNFAEFNSNIMDKMNVYFYSNISNSFNFYPNYLHAEMQKKLQSNSEIIQKFQALAIQMTSSQGMLYSNVFLQYNPIEENRHRTVWESYLDTVTTSKPTLVETHKSNDKEIFIQDETNSIYMLNKTGRILWKKRIKEKINSEIHPIDFYKNGKLQYAFSTANHLYIVDRLGNFVEEYPIRLPSPSTAGMSLFDYDNNRDYRIIIPCEDKKIYLYNKEGSVLKGWSFGTTDSYVTEPVEHIKIAGSDYIVFKDNYNIFILNRRGETRVNVEEKFESSPKNTLIFEPARNGNKDRLITTNVNGDIKYIYFDGKVETVKMEDFSKYHYFTATDIDKDGAFDYIYVDNDDLKVFSSKTKKELYSYDFESNIYHKPVVYEFSTYDHKIGVVDKDDEKLYLFNNDGSLYKGFPVKGTTQFSIGLLNRQKMGFNLIVGSGDNFLYNYDVK